MRRAAGLLTVVTATGAVGPRPVRLSSRYRARTTGSHMLWTVATAGMPRRRAQASAAQANGEAAPRCTCTTLG